MSTAPRYAPFVYVFVPFALLLTAGNLFAEMAPNLTLGRIVATILLSAAFALPAIALFFRIDLTKSPRAFRYWQLFWTFGFIGYALHSYYSVVVWFEGDFAQIWQRQRGFVAITNFTLLATWGVDVLFGLFGPTAGGRPVRILRWMTHTIFVIAFFVAAVVFRSEFRTTSSLALGITIPLVAAISLALRWWK